MMKQKQKNILIGGLRPDFDRYENRNKKMLMHSFANSPDGFSPSGFNWDQYSTPILSTSVMTFETLDGGFFSVACHKKKSASMKKDLQLQGYILRDQYSLMGDEIGIAPIGKSDLEDITDTLVEMTPIMPKYGQNDSLAFEKKQEKSGYAKLFSQDSKLDSYLSRLESSPRVQKLSSYAGDNVVLITYKADAGKIKKCLARKGHIAGD